MDEIRENFHRPRLAGERFGAALAFRFYCGSKSNSSNATSSATNQTDNRIGAADAARVAAYGGVLDESLNLQDSSTHQTDNSLTLTDAHTADNSLHLSDSSSTDNSLTLTDARSTTNTNSGNTTTNITATDAGAFSAARAISESGAEVLKEISDDARANLATANAAFGSAVGTANAAIGANTSVVQGALGSVNQTISGSYDVLGDANANLTKLALQIADNARKSEADTQTFAKTFAGDLYQANTSESSQLTKTIISGVIILGAVFGVVAGVRAYKGK